MSLSVILDVVVRCYQCGTMLDVRREMEGGGRVISVDVHPCAECLKKVYREGLQAGRSMEWMKGKVTVL